VSGVNLGSAILLSLTAPNCCRDKSHKGPVVQPHGIPLSFHGEMADPSREFGA
jgi:hypothetical protein